MKISLKRAVAAFVAVMTVISILPFTAYSADWIPSDCKDYVFDAEYYAAKYPEGAEEYGTAEDELYTHFQNQGVDEGKQVVTINVELFGRETPVEISFSDIKKM